MASTVPAKSQPLHNFALPHLKWKKNHHSNNHHRGRSAKVSSSADADSASSPSRHDSPQRQSHSPLFQSPMREAPPCLSPMRRDDSVSEPTKDKKVTAHRRNSQNTAPENGKKGTLESSPNQAFGKSQKKHKVSEVDVIWNKEGRSKILLKLRRKNRVEEIHEERKADELQVEGKDTASVDKEATEEPVSKTWNLRPRKPTSRNVNGGQFKAGGSAMNENITQSFHRNPIRLEAEPNGSERKKRQRFCISLSKEEIEDDIFAITGSKLARRPKKRAKAVQKQLDNLFPGLWLASITPDSYKVSENLQKV